MSASLIQPLELHKKLKAVEELAFLDVREQGVHAQGHPFWSVPMPLSSLELRAERLLPRKTVDIYLLDQGDGEGLAIRAASVLQAMGYTNLHIIDGGVTGWHSAGLEIFSGVNVPSKAFGEFVEHQYETPHISASDLNARLEKGEKVTVLDSRPFEEYHRMSIPTGIDMPGAELVLRIFDTVQDEATPIVVNCAGRTRSIIGAQSLINAGIKNPVMALKDGTMGWYLAGHKLANDANDVARMPSEASLEKSINAARIVGKKANVAEISASELDSVKAQAGQRSVFILDVRTQEEFLKGHIQGSKHAPGGQLVQATDEYVAVKNAQLVLVDDKEVRAWMSAAWLRQIGWEHVSVLTDFSGLILEDGADVLETIGAPGEVSPLELDAAVASGDAIAVLDLANSLAYRKSHIPGSHWIIRSRLAADLTFLPPAGYIVITADDERLARLAVAEVSAACPQAIVHVLRGGNEAWRDAGLACENGDIRLLSKQDDIWYKPYDNKEKIRERMQEYLDWEVALVPQVERDGSANFRIFK